MLRSIVSELISRARRLATKLRRTGHRDLVGPISFEYWDVALGSPIPLYRGPIEFARGDQKQVLEGVVEFAWLPTPRSAYRAHAKDLRGIPEALDAQVPGEQKIRLVGEDSNFIDTGATNVVATSDEAGVGVSISGAFPPYESGAPLDLRRVTFGVINFVNPVGADWISVGPGRSGWLGRMKLTSGDWQLTIDARRDLNDVIAELQSSGGYAFTHAAEVTRTDQREFSWEAAKSFVDTAWIVLSFARGALAGFALFDGYNTSGTRVWRWWHHYLADGWGRGAPTWADRVTPACVTELYPRFAAKTSDDFWRTVLHRAVRYFVEGNDPNPIDRAVVMTQAGLELLCWAIIEDQPAAFAGKSSRSAADRIRAAMEWAGIPTSAPPTAAELQAVIDFRGTDAQDALTWVRNQITHPKRATPHATALGDAWRYGARLLELLILRCVDYRGPHSNRFVATHVGEVEPVPWDKSQ